MAAASALFLAGTALGGAPVWGQAAPKLAVKPPADTSSQPAAAPLPGSGTIRSIGVSGAQRLEADTVRSYVKLRAGEPYTRESLDQALKDLYATELFADVQIAGADTGNLIIQVRENPVVNRIVLEGNKRLKEDKIRPEIKLSPRQIFTRSKARADVARIIQLYQRQGRYAATVEPKMVQLDQNRVDIVFEISEGAKSKVRRINIIGNKEFSDGRLRGEMATKQTGLTKIFSSGTSYDPDRMSYDQQKMRQFYLTQGYADFRVVSAVAELTPDKRNFIITYVVEEGKRYKFGNINVESDIHDLKPEVAKAFVKAQDGAWYNAKLVEDTVDAINETAGLLGYAFADVRPDFDRDPEKLTMSVTFRIAESPRVYVERVDINGNTITRDKVVRREFRLAEGDAFNGFRVKRSRDRIQSLGYFQDKLEIEQKQGSAPDKVILEANVEEKSTGELQVSAGYSSLERFIVNLSVTQRNFMGKGQELRASADWSRYSKSVSVGFTEPYVFDKNIAVGGDIFRRDYNSFNYINDNERNTTYQQTTTGFQLRAGVPLTEYWSLALRYGLSYDQVTLDRNSFYLNGECSPLLAGRYLCDSIGNRFTSSVGYSLAYDNLDNRIRPTRGNRLLFSQDFAGVGGDVRYLRTTASAKKYFNIGSGFIFSTSVEGGYIKGIGQQVRLIDRFQLGEPQIRGFNIRGVGPRVIRKPYDISDPANPVLVADRQQYTDDALGGNAYYLGRLELELPLGNGARELGLRPSIFADAGAVFNVRKPQLLDNCAGSSATNPCTGTFIPVRDNAGNPLYLEADGTYVTVPTATTTAVGNTITPFREEYFGNTPKPRLSVGIGVNWNSPFGPLRIDLAKALLKSPGDNTKLFSFNVGTQF
ncbi:outer membrane protein assembly factor BamA [Sphingomonas naphthae]|uniref:Outer membrane protein assembly factor BamA n=1 Tax=Sphingomonas naphthae TaxID=1813468 RepID=A0ABY7TQ98_9SPHN|nr:outer membrane protein assembly factor BamA [Sphingomonas naphthae]WCT75422.1 outer membrane protein assembly factor BamA [Sphingomonas naphthae]